MTAPSAVAIRKPSAMEALITSPAARAAIEPFLPKGVDIQRVAASVLMAVRKDETGLLGKCTPTSLVLGVSQIHQWGLELAPGVAYLLPFKNNKKGVVEAVPCADYKALAAMMVASGAVRHVEAREVREGDDFSFSFGLDGYLKHQPYGGKERDKKPITHAYVILHLPFQARAFDVMTAEQIDDIRRQYSKQHKEGPLKAFYAKKTVIRQIAKTMPKDARLARFFNAIESEAIADVTDGAVAQLSEELPTGVSAGEGSSEVPPDGFDDRDLAE